MTDDVKAGAGSEPKSAASKLFDLRYLIGGLMALYGLVLIVVGLFDSPAEIDKAAGIRINLWMGLGMLAVGLLFLLWARLRPLRLGTPDTGDTGPAGRTTGEVPRH